jgi:DNA-binding NarL/FixJ family response regulator
MINVVLADRQTLTREGIIAVLSSVPGIHISGMASTSSQLIELLHQFKPHVAIIDHHYDNSFTITDIKNIIKQFAFLNILILSNQKSTEDIHELIKCGIKNYVFKQCDTNEIIQAVFAAAQGKQYFCKSITRLFNDENLQGNSAELALLSSRETEIIRLVAAGMTNKEIADKLFLSIHTVKTHRKNIIKKLGFTFKNAAELIQFTSIQ